MNKFIKFKLIDKFKKHVGYMFWDEGSYNEELKCYYRMPCWKYSKDNINWTTQAMEYQKIVQWTGKEDKDGNEIYEED